jgi:hypothetical protein
MSPEDIKKLLGGYATGTLTTEEQQALFAAALDDQELFDELAREQSLRDLLRDPAARAELLDALDTRASRVADFWLWLRRPVVAGLAAAGVAALAIGVWRGARVASLKPTAAPVMVAELERPKPLAPAHDTHPAPGAQIKGADSAARVTADKKTARATELPSRQFEGGTQSPMAGPAVELMKEKKAVIAPAPLAAPTVPDNKAVGSLAPPPPPPPAPAVMPTFMARKAEAASDAAARPSRQLQGAVVGGVAPLDARALFYLDRAAPAANAFVPSSGGGGAALPHAALAAPRKDAAVRLGVRVSILRATGEVDLTTVLDPGETIRLKLIPNADGFLYVTEGARTVASGQAQRWQPFETPELRFEGSGQKQLTVLLSRRPQTLSPQLLLESLARDNLVQSPAGQEPATYIVSGPRDAGAQEVVVPVSLTYR